MTASKAIWTWYYASAAPAPPPPPPPPCPPLPTRYTVVTFDVPNAEITYSGGSRSDDDTVFGWGLASPPGNWYYHSLDDVDVLTLTVTDPTATPYNRVKMRKAGALKMTMYGDMGTVREYLFDPDAFPAFVQIDEWQLLAGLCGEAIASLTFTYNRSGLWAIDDVEFGTAP